MDELEIQYPCECVYTVIGENDALMRDAIALVFWSHEYSVEFSNKNKAGTYISLIVKAKVNDEDERYKLCALVAKQPAVKMVL